MSRPYLPSYRDLTDSESIDCLNSFNVIHRTGIAKQNIAQGSVAGQSLEFSHPSPFDKLSNGLLCGMSCSNTCKNRFSDNQYLIEEEKFAGRSNVTIGANVAVVSANGIELRFDVLKCFNMDLSQFSVNPINGTFENINHHFKLLWDRFDGVNGYHGCILLKVPIDLVDPITKCEMCVVDANTVTFTENSFDLTPWQICPNRFVRMPHSIANWIQDSNDMSQFANQKKQPSEDDLIMVEFMCSIFNSAIQKSWLTLCADIDDVLFYLLNKGGVFSTSYSFDKLDSAMQEFCDVETYDIFVELMKRCDTSRQQVED